MSDPAVAVAALVARRQDLRREDPERGSRPAVTARLGWPWQRLTDYEEGRVTPGVLSLQRWAEELGCDVTLSLSPKDLR
ncbi:hypothetical protein E1091_06555 [Micromonospora fluostatini]|uniref:XRE family transcriptional regulator n=1 Tax=Micromonospora fluostatini TaxID=1629071 RepID=A0ABY2DIS2_9ACTN|nr:hypothetical protein E1091_06555 [Micromonospora fluostatini]